MDKNKSSILVWHILVLLTLFVLVCGFNTMKTDDGLEMRWSNSAMPIGWFLDSDGSDDLPLSAVQSALQDAFEIWQSIPCAAVSFEYRGEVNLSPDDCGTIPVDHRNVMIWNEESWPDEWRGAIAVCQPVYNPRTGEIIDADIVFDGYDYHWSATEYGRPDKMDLWNVATHEIGHLLGLAHPGEDGTQPHPEATMHPSSFQGETFRRYPALDDIFGVCHLYPHSGELGWSCQTESDCATGYCISDEHSNQNFCSITCDSTKDCPKPFLCSSGGFCVPRWFSLSFLGDLCDSTHPCAHGYECLTDPISGTQVCARECGSGCPDGFSCLPTDTTEFCFPASASGRTIGEYCSDEALCNPRYECVEIYKLGSRCTRNCPPECPPEFDCLSLTSGEKVCWPSTQTERELGRECAWGQHCASGLCAKDGEVFRCSQECSTSCPDGFECRDTEDETGTQIAACLPIEATPNARAHILYLNTNPPSPAPPSNIEISCEADSANGVLYQLWYISPDGVWGSISDWSTTGAGSILLVQDGLHRFVCWARDQYSPELFDDAEFIELIIDSSIVLDGDNDQSESVKPFEETNSGSESGCNGFNLELLLLSTILLTIGRRRLKRLNLKNL